MADCSCNINAWEVSFRRHLKREAQSTLTIPKVPERLRRGDEDAYDPRIISFGPYHHGKARLRAMEKYKYSFLDVILSFRPQIPLERYREAIKKEEGKIRECYTDDFDTDIKSDDFVDMMLVDGCFLVGYLLQFHYGVDELDSIFVGMRDVIQYDILLLENQLPFFILIKIFDILEFTRPSSFMDLAIEYINCRVSDEKGNFQPPISVHHHFQPPRSVHHLLHLYHSRCLCTPQAGEGIPVSITREESDHIPIRLHTPLPPSATVLYEAGVKFEKKEVKGSSSSLDVTFNKTNGKMMIPTLVIDSFAKSILRNLVAFEQLYPNFSNEFNKSFTAYVQFMDFIVNTAADVALLHKEGIIRHCLGSDKKAADFLNDLSRGFSVQTNHYLANLYRDVSDYQKKNGPKWWAMLMHKYCDSPWAVLGIVAGGILLVFTLAQTVFSGISTF